MDFLEVSKQRFSVLENPIFTIRERKSKQESDGSAGKSDPSGSAF